MVIIAGAGPGDPKLLTLHALEAIRSADVIIYDNLVSTEILEWAKPNAELRNMGKCCGKASATQEAIHEALLEAYHRVPLVLRLKGGDPFVFGRGGEEAVFLRQHGVPFQIIPGISSVLASAAYAGIPMTHRGKSVSFAVVTGHEAAGKEESDIDWKSLAGVDTIMVLMGVGSRQEIARRLIGYGRSPSEGVAFVENASRTNQKVLRTTLAELSEIPIAVNSPAVMIIGPVTDLDLSWFAPPPAKVAITPLPLS